MDYPLTPREYFHRYQEWHNSVQLMLRLAECFCGKCIVCQLLRPSIQLNEFPPVYIDEEGKLHRDQRLGDNDYDERYEDPDCS